MPEVNRRQAMVPRGATVIENPRGSAPGLLIDPGMTASSLLLPGPPREMRPMMSGPIAERLARVAGERRLLRRALRIAGRSESRVDEQVSAIYRPWQAEQPRIDTTILASPGFIELHLSAQVTDLAGRAPAHSIAPSARSNGRLGPDVVNTTGAPLEQTVGEMLRARGLAHRPG